MELNFKEMELCLQEYINGGDHYVEDSPFNRDSVSLKNDLDKVTPSQRLGFIEKYMEFVSPKQLRRGTSTASDDKDFNLVEAPSM